MYVAVVATLNSLDAEKPIDILDQIEMLAIRQAFAACNGNVTHTAQRLGLHRQTLQRKLRRILP